MTAPFAPLTLPELYGLEVPSLEWVVQGLLPAGSAALLAAREKSGKGLITIDLCACVALEEPFLGREVRGGLAVYCAAEEDVRTVRDRVKARVGDVTEAPFHVLRLDGSTSDVLDLERPETVGQLDRMMTDLEPAIVVIDTLREIHRGREDVSDDMAPLLRPIRQLAHKHGTVILVNHHMSRSGSSRGSTSIPAAFDQVLEFAKDEGPGSDDTLTGTLRVQGRDVRKLALRIAFGEGGRWKLNQVAASFPEDGTRARIVHLLQDRPGLIAAEIAKALALETRSVQNLLGQMRRDAPPLIAVDSGSGAKGSPYRWRAVQGRIIHHDGSSLGREDVMNDPEAAEDASSMRHRDESGAIRYRRCGCGGQVAWGEPCSRCHPDRARTAA